MGLRSGDGDRSPSGSETTLLLVRARGGDLEAVKGILVRFYPALLSFLRTRLPGWSRGYLDAQDLAQEVCARVLDSLPRMEFRGMAPFWAYLRTISLHCVVDVARKDHGEARPLSDDSGCHPPAPEATPSAALIREEESRAYERALECLTEERRHALLLRLELGLDFASVAQECGLPSADAARMVVHRAMGRVAREMSRAGFGA
jgi:RNA polymerase sigma-70 factor (ECF subfamily)